MNSHIKICLESSLADLNVGIYNERTNLVSGLIEAKNIVENMFNMHKISIEP